MNTNNLDKKSEAILETLRLEEDLMQQVSPILEKQEPLQETVTSVKATLPTIEVPVIPKNPIFTILGELALSTQIPDYSFTNPILSQISSGVTKIVQAFSSEVSQSLAKTVGNITLNLGRTMAEALQSPTMKWLQSLDLSPMYKTLEALGEIYKQREAFRNAYLAAMYECKWFPYAGWLADSSLAAAVSEVIKTSRGASMRREKRIDRFLIPVP